MGNVRRADAPAIPAPLDTGGGGPPVGDGPPPSDGPRPSDTDLLDPSAPRDTEPAAPRPTPDAPARAFPSDGERQRFQDLIDAARTASPPDPARVTLLGHVGELSPPQSSQALDILARGGGDPAVVAALGRVLGSPVRALALPALLRAVQTTPAQTSIVVSALVSDNPAAALAAYTQIAREAPGLPAAQVGLLVDAVGRGRRGPLTEGIMSAAQAGRAARALAAMPEPQRTELSTLLTNAPSDQHRQLILKALAARAAMIPGRAADAMLTLTTFAGAIAPLSSAEAVRRGTLAETPTTSRPPSSVGAFAQQFTTSCGPTTVSIAEGEADPVQALLLHDPVAARGLQERLMNENSGGTTLRRDVHLGIALETDHRDALTIFLEILLEIITLSLAETGTLYDAKADVDVLRRFTGILPLGEGETRPTREQALVAANRLYGQLDGDTRRALGVGSGADVLRLAVDGPGRLDTSEFLREASADLARRQGMAALPEALFDAGLPRAMRNQALDAARNPNATITDQFALYDHVRPEIRERYEAAASEADVNALMLAPPGMTRPQALRRLGAYAFVSDLRGLVGTGRPPNATRGVLLDAIFARAETRMTRADFIAGVSRNSGTNGTSLGNYLGTELTPLTGARYDAERVTTGSSDDRNLATSIADSALARYEHILVEDGLDIPIRIAARGNGEGHFLLITDARSLPGPSGGPERHFLVQDPWTGRAVWATDAELRSGSFLARLTPGDNRIITDVYVPVRTDVP